MVIVCISASLVVSYLPPVYCTKCVISVLADDIIFSSFFLVALLELPSAPQSLELAPAPGVWNFAWLAAFDGNVLAPLKYFLIRRTAGQGNRSLLATNGLSLSLNVSLLQPFTDYSFTVVAENILGRGPESNSFAMRTPQASKLGLCSKKPFL